MKGTQLGKAVLAGAIGLFLHSIVFSQTISPPDNRSSVIAASSELVVGEWTRMFSGTTLNLWGVFGSASAALAVGDGGKMLRFDGLGWSYVPTPTTLPLMSVWGDARTGTVFAVGASGNIFRYRDDDVERMLSNTVVTLRSVWGSNAEDVWAVGDGGATLHYDGESWRRVQSGTVLPLMAVIVTETGGAFAAGALGTLLRFDANSDRWQRMESGATAFSLNGLWAFDDDDVFAVGNGGTVLRFDGYEWIRMDTPTTMNLNGVWGTSPSRVFAVGDNGTLLTFDGSDWTLDRVDTYAPLNAIKNGLIVGSGGVMFQNALLYPEFENLRITEVDPVGGYVEVTNTGPAFVSGAHPFVHENDFRSSIPEGTEFSAGGIVVFPVRNLDQYDSDLWLYRTVPFSNSENLVHGVKYGPKPYIGQTSTAVEAGKWPSGTAFAPAPPVRASLAYDGYGYEPKDWYVDETPTLGEPDYTEPGVVERSLQYPEGTQDFEEMSLGDEVSAIDGWAIEDGSGAEGMFTARVVEAPGGGAGFNRASTRCLQIRDQDSSDRTGRVNSPTISTQGELFYSWTFDVDVDGAPENRETPGLAPRLMIQHELADSRVGEFEDAWGFELHGNIVYLVVVDADGTSRKSVLSTTGLPLEDDDWLELSIVVDILAGETGIVGAVYDATRLAELPIEQTALNRLALDTFRMSYDGSGVGNTGALLLDKVSVDVPVAAPLLWTGVSARSTNQGATVEWDLFAEVPLEGFLVYRKTNKEIDPVLLTEDPLAGDTRRFDDFGVDLEIDNGYVVVALAQDGGVFYSPWTNLEDAPAEAVSIGRFRARAETGQVYLQWELLGDESIDGFRVYRREVDGALQTVSGAALLSATRTSFSDEDVVAWGTYHYVVAVVKRGGEEVYSQETTVTVRTTAYALSNGFPNPFAAATVVKYTLPEATHVTLNVYDVRGALIATIANGTRPAGVYTARWDGRDRNGVRVSGGAYFVKLQAKNAVLTRKIVLVR